MDRSPRRSYFAPSRAQAGIASSRFQDFAVHSRNARSGLQDRPGLTFHSLRHTFAVHFLEGGAAVTDLQGFLGHANLATTQIYARMVDTRTRASLNALNYGFGGGADRVSEETLHTPCTPRLAGTPARSAAG